MPTAQASSWFDFAWEPENSGLGVARMSMQAFRAMLDAYEALLDLDAAAKKNCTRPKVLCGLRGYDWLAPRPDLIESLMSLVETIMCTPYLDWLLVTSTPENFAAVISRAFDAFTMEGERHMEEEMYCPDDTLRWLALANEYIPLHIGLRYNGQSSHRAAVSRLLAIPARGHFLLTAANVPLWLTRGGELTVAEAFDLDNARRQIPAARSWKPTPPDR